MQALRAVWRGVVEFWRSMGASGTAGWLVPALGTLGGIIILTFFVQLIVELWVAILSILVLIVVAVLALAACRR